MPKVLLINPPIVGSFYNTPPLGLAYVGTALKKAGHDVVLVDCCSRNMKLDSLAGLVTQLHPDYVGVTGFTIQYPAVRKLFPAIKQVDSAITTVFGGPHASVLTEYVMSDIPEIDFVIKGEGENAFPALIEALANGHRSDNNLRVIPGIAFREQVSRQIVVNPPSPIADLDDLGYPWQVVNPLAYSSARVHGFMAKRLPIAQVISSRGCPYQCTYCGGPLVLGRKVRVRDPKKFVDEIEFLIKMFGIREIQIIDDNFTFYKEHAAEVCQEILKRRLDITWSLPNGIRADRVDYELLQLMREAGCYYLAFGIEFGSEKILKLTRKNLSLKKARESVLCARKLGYITQGFFMMGHPLEEKEDILATIKLGQEMPFDRVSMDFLMPLPGSNLFDYYRDKGYLNLNDINWEQFGNRRFVPKTEFITCNDLCSLLRTATVKICLNPLRILRYLSKLRSVNQVRGLFAGARVLLLSVLRKQGAG